MRAGASLGGAGSVFLDLAAGDAHVCGLCPNGTVLCSGQQSAASALTPPAGALFQSISAGVGVTCGITRPDSPTGPGAGAVLCWGDVASSIVNGSKPAGPFLEVAVGDTHACALSCAGNVTCFGAVPAAQRLSANTSSATNSTSAPANATATAANATASSPGYSWLSAGGNVTCGISNTPNRALSCFTLSGETAPLFRAAVTAAEVACGGGTCCALTDAGALVCESTSGVPVYVSRIASNSTWAPLPVAGSWKAVASSADGSRLLAAGTATYLFVSWDGGATWAARTSTLRTYYSVAVNADGSRMAAAGYNAPLLTSVDGGVTWATRDTRAWRSVASSADGLRLAAGAYNSYVFTSTDGGASWTQRAAGSGTRYWQALSSSADGLRLLACTSATDWLYVSTNGGATWASVGTAQRTYSGVASSADGLRLVAVANTGFVYTSTDGGGNWTARSFPPALSASVSVASSSDGMRLVAGGAGRQLFVSADGGETWAARDGTRSWQGVAASADGTRLFAADGASSSSLVYATLVPSCLADADASCNTSALVASRAAVGPSDALVTPRMNSLGSSALGLVNTSGVSLSAGTLSAATLAGWPPTLSVLPLDLRPTPLSRIAAGAFAAPSSCFAGLPALWLSGGPSGLAMQPGCLAGLGGVSSINSATSGVVNASGLGLQLDGTPGAFSLDLLAGINTSALTALDISNRRLADWQPTSVTAFPGVRALTLRETSGQCLLRAGALAGLPLLDRINSEGAGVANMSGLGLYTGAPGEFSLDALAALSSLPAIGALDLSGNGITDLQPMPAPATPLPGIRSLWLRPADTGGSGSEPAIAPALRIRSGSLAGLVSLEALNSNASGVADLSGLGLHSSVPGALSLDALADLRSGAITSLDLTGNGILSLEPMPPASAASSWLPGLRSLRIGPQARTASGAGAGAAAGSTPVGQLQLQVGSFAACGGVEALDLSGAGAYVGDAGTLSLDAFSGLTATTAVNLAHNGIQRILPPSLPATAAFTGASLSLNLSGNAVARVTDVKSGLSPICSNSTRPLYLDLSDNRIAGLASGDFASGWQYLYSLDLTNNSMRHIAEGAFQPFGNANLDALQYASGNPALLSPCPSGEWNTLFSFNNMRGVLIAVPACAICRPGSYCANGVNTPCPAGRYNGLLAQSGEAACVPCPAGTTNTLTGQSRMGCVPCPAGTASPLNGSSSDASCAACALGYFASSNGQSSRTAPRTLPTLRRRWRRASRRASPTSSPRRLSA